MESVLKLFLFLVVLGLALYLPTYYWVKRKLRNEPPLAQQIRVTKPGLIVFVILGVISILGVGYRYSYPESAFSQLFDLPGKRTIYLLLMTLAVMAIGSFLHLFGLRLFEKKELVDYNNVTTSRGSAESTAVSRDIVDAVSRKKRILPQLFILLWLSVLTYDSEFNNGVFFHAWVDGHIVALYLLCLPFFGIIAWRNIVKIKTRDTDNKLWIIVSLMGILWSVYGLIGQGPK